MFAEHDPEDWSAHWPEDEDWSDYSDEDDASPSTERLLAVLDDSVDPRREAGRWKPCGIYGVLFAWQRAWGRLPVGLTNRS